MTRQAADPRPGAADRGQLRQAARAAAQALRSLRSADFLTRPVSNLRHFLVRPDLGTCSTGRF